MTGRLTILSFAFILLTVGFTVAGQVLYKWGMLGHGAFPTDLASAPRYLLSVFTDWRILLALTCGAGAALSWTVAISRTEISVAYPFMALSIVLVLALSPMLFGESISLARWLGVGVVAVGLWLGSR